MSQPSALPCLQLKRYEGPVEDLCLDFTGRAAVGVLAGFSVHHPHQGSSFASLALCKDPLHTAYPLQPLMLLHKDVICHIRTYFHVRMCAAVESDFLGSTVSEELVPGGSRLAVTQGNLLQVGCCLHKGFPRSSRLPHKGCVRLACIAGR